MRKPFLSNYSYFIERRIFAQNYKFSNKNDLLCAWRDFKKNVDMINETLSHKVHQYSILIGETMVESAIVC